MSTAKRCAHCGQWHDVAQRCDPAALRKAWEQVLTDDDRRRIEQDEVDAMARYEATRGTE